MMETIYKIRKKGTKMYSRGRVSATGLRGKRVYGVRWKANGKEWPSEKALKAHLLKCIEQGVDMDGWEIMEFTQQPSKAFNDWCDAKMTMARLKRQHVLQ